MKNERTLIYLQKRINSLEEQNKILKQENKILEQENYNLQTVNQSMHHDIDSLRKEHDNTLKIYQDGFVEINKLKEEYKKLILVCRKEKKEYDDRMRNLLKRFKK